MMFEAVNAILGCALVGLFTAGFITIFAHIGIFPAVFIDTIDVKDDEGA